MDYITLILIALGLAADAFAVAVTNGICSYKISGNDVLFTGTAFGFYQAAMPVAGFFIGKTFSGFILRYQHWVALFLLCAIGLNMLTEAVNDWKHKDETYQEKNLFTIKNLTLQGIATSIDALAAGVSFAVLQINIFSAALLIGTITFISCCLGVCIGRLFGALLGFRARLVGGLILIGIGLKIFVENQFLCG
jgi:putative Mn2+ efflux pump MntP